MSSAITYNDEPILLEDTVPSVGDPLPFFRLVNTHLEDITLDAYDGQRKIIHIFPSIDTPTSARGVRHLQQMASELGNTVILHVSADMPFALARFATLEQFPDMIALSTLRGRDMTKNYGVLMVTSKLAGLPARALLVADEHNQIVHVELVKELSAEPDYNAAIRALTIE